VKIKVLLTCEVVIQTGILKNYSDALSDSRLLALDVSPANHRSSRCLLEYSGKNGNERGLACPIGTEQAEEFALFDLQAYFIQRGNASEFLDEGIYGYYRGNGASST
jgi:hypothetical protein